MRTFNDLTTPQPEPKVFMLSIQFDVVHTATPTEAISPLNLITLPYGRQFVRQIAGLHPGITVHEAAAVFRSGGGIPGRAGTAFLMKNSTTTWLVTAFHSLRDSEDPHNFTELVESGAIIVCQPGGQLLGLDLHDGRRVRLVRKAGEIVDFVAVEVRPWEVDPTWIPLPNSPILGSEAAAAIVQTARCWPRRGGQRLRLVGERPALSIGFPAANGWSGAEPVCIRVAAAPDVAGAVSWVSAYLGDSSTGCSGGPMLFVETGRLVLAGLQVTGNGAFDNSDAAVIGGAFVPLSIVLGAVADGDHPNGVSVFES